MLLEILPAIGGVGLFLLGMVVLTDGLRSLAGGAMRRVLTRFTKNPVSGAATGALTTAIVQSSSATTVATVGFVGAGLMSFPQALGIIFGANIGTTITGWMVAIIGFKLNLGDVLLPLVLVGVLLRMFGRGRIRHAGWALAGFGALFVGIDAMQQGMAAFDGVATPASFPSDTLFGRIQLVLIGVVITLVTQSSSAGVAAALVALGAGAISFPQAAAMVIGMDVGTTFTAALATIGGSTATRRTGYAHVIYNALTGVMAFFLLVPYVAIAGNYLVLSTKSDAQIALVAFHTTFNIIGVLAIIGFTRPFAQLIIRLVPERGPKLIDRLDERLLADPEAATDAGAATIRDTSLSLFAILNDELEPESKAGATWGRLQTVEEAQEATRRFAERIKTDPENTSAHRRHLAMIHALDHLNRLFERCNQRERIETLQRAPYLRRLSADLREVLAGLAIDNDIMAAEIETDRIRRQYRREQHLYRERTIETASQGEIDAELAIKRLDSVRWLHRVAYHIWRILHHLQRAEEEEPVEAAYKESALEVQED